MIGIIQDWLFSQLGIYFNFDKLEERNGFQNGSIFAHLLQNYGLLSSDFTVNITNEWGEDVCQKNLKLLKPVFDMLSVNFDNNVILNILKNNKVAIIKLLYELYVCLENKQHLYFITQEKFERVKKSHIDSLKNSGIFVNNVQIESLTKDEDICLKKSLVDNKDLVEWYKQKFMHIKNNMRSRLLKLKATPSNQDSKVCYTNIKQKRCPCSCTNGAADEGLVAYLPDLDMFLKSSSHEGLLDYKQFIASFKEKQHRRSVKQHFEKNIQNDLLQETWNEIMMKQNEIYNSVFSQIMLKQSQYEKQILTKLVQTQKQIKVENENLIYTTSKTLEEEEMQLKSDFILKEEFEKLESSYENEQKRVLELHRKLYNRNQDLKKKKHYEMCLDVLDSLIDLALNASEYQSKYGVTVPTVLWNSWKQHFYKSQSVHIPLQMLERSISTDESVDYDDVIDFEKQNSAIVNENDVDEYLYTCGRWFYEDICKEYGNVNENALAFIVYRLLTLKYPPPPSPLPANLPTFKVAGVLLDFYNADSIEKLKLLLSKPRIHIFDPETAIKTCVSKFEEETLGNNDETALKKSKQTKSAKNEKKVKKGGSAASNKDSKGKKSGKKKQGNIENNETKEEGICVENKEEGAFNLANKETQTSIINEQTTTKEKERSPLGMIGEQILKSLKEGKTIEDEFLVNIIIEYLKTLNEYDGWVLLNYPTTINQASIIELALSGKRLPIEDYVLGDEEFVVEENVTDENAPKRKSKILQCPIDEKSRALFKTSFTVFIKTNPNTIEHYEYPVEKDYKDEHLSLNERATGSNISFKSTEVVVPDVLVAFYKDQSIYQNFKCESNDLVVLKKLARAILEDDSLEQTASVDLFGKEILDKLSKSSKKEKKDKIKKPDQTKSSQKKLGHKDITSEKKILDTQENENIEFKELLDIEQTCNTTNESLLSKTVSPGDEGWQFVDLPLVEDIAVILATVWENIENSYLQNLEDICFETRLINLRLVPYSTYVKETIKSVAQKPDVRQDLVLQFQQYFQSFDDNLRALPEVKNHLFCKVLEMQENLWKIMDDKKNEVESKRKELIFENWLINELCMLINNYLSLMQTEYDKSVSTFMLVGDYYLTMLEKIPPGTINSQAMDFKVPKVTADDLMFGLYETLQNNKKSDKFSSLSNGTINQSVRVNSLAQNLIDCNENQKIIKTINTFVPREVEHISHILQSVNHTFLLQIKAEEDFLVTANKKLTKEKNLTGKVNKLVERDSEKTKVKRNSKRKNLSDSNSDKVTRHDFVQNNPSNNKNIEFDANQQGLLLTEWKFVVDTEFDRFKLRMNLISSRAQEDIMEFYCYLESVFCELFSTNLSTYDIDINNTNKLCDYLRTAIEEESSLMHPLVLKRSEFYIDITQSLTKEHEYDKIKVLFEQTQDYCFTINQLKKLMAVFKIAGPHGVIRKQPFCYILQDLMLFNDTDNQPHLPKMWNLLNESQLLFVLEDMFSFEYAINWRDFLIYNLEIPYPSSDEILSLRKQFMSHDLESTEVVSIQVYDSIKLWFEQDLPNNPQEGLRFALIKELLLEMFQVNENTINYTALLLYFCKDYDPKNGLKKALCLSIGKNVITSKEELDEILKEEAEIKASVLNLIENLINSIVHAKEGTLIYEVFDSISDFDVDFLNTNYSVSEMSESKSGSFVSEVVDNGREGIDDSFYDKKESLTPVERSLENGFLHIDKTWVSKIPIATVISVLNASFLHQDKTFTLRNQYLNSLVEDSDEEGFIEAYVLVTVDWMNKLFKLTNKFKITSPREILEKSFHDLDRLSKFSL